ncbi:MAG: hypothetical protein IKN43_07325 [Selenomonadaceae bacterium]|nr:hypothetical protein [Selenomonadaceae bacterium]
MKPNSERKQEKRERRAYQLKIISSMETKKMLVEFAQKIWKNENEQGQVSFSPSLKLCESVKKILKHDIGEIFITASDIRHIKKKHSSGEDARGQVNIDPQHFEDLYDVINEFDTAEIGDTDKQGNKSIKLSKQQNGMIFSAITERGLFKM